jgi:hypothetical protein
MHLVLLAHKASYGGVGRQTYSAFNMPPALPRLIKVPRASKLI